MKLPKTYHAQPINNDAEIEPIDWEAGIERLKTEAEAKIHRDNQQREAARLKAMERKESGQISPVYAFNDQNDIESVLRNYGYKQSGKRWLSPESESGQPGVIISDDGQHWISSHGCDATKGSPINNGTWGDAFDLYCFYEWGNDRKAALKAVGDTITTPDGITISKHNQRLHKQQEAANECMEAFEDLSQTGGAVTPPPSIDRVDLLKPPGIAGDICELIRREARRERPELYPFAALHLLSLAGRHCYSDYTKKLNLFTLGIAVTGAGKEVQQNILKKLASKVGLERIFAESGSFKQIIEDLIDSEGSSLYIIDEIHSFFNSMSNKNAQTYETKMESEVLKLLATLLYTFRGEEQRKHSQSLQKQINTINSQIEDLAEKIKDDGRPDPDGEIAKFRESKEKERRQKISILEKLEKILGYIKSGWPLPYLGIMGHSTPHNLDAFVSSDRADSGMLGRALIIRCAETRSQLKRSIKLEPEGKNKLSLETRIVCRLSAIHDSSDPHIKTTPEAAAFIDECIDWFDDDEQLNDSLMGAIYTRAPEHLTKVATILALYDREITLDHAKYAYALVMSSIKDIRYLLQTNSGSNNLIIQSAIDTIHRNSKQPGIPPSRLKQIVEKSKGFADLKLKTKNSKNNDLFEYLIHKEIKENRLTLLEEGKKKRYVSLAA